MSNGARNGATLYNFFLRTCWYGGSSYDAWLNISSTKIAARLLTLPNATAAIGLPSAIILFLLQLAIGYWTSCIINVLYLRHKKSLGNSESTHSIQLHEIVGGLLGPRWLTVSTLLNVGNFFCISTLQLLACSNLVYFINDNLEKRTWVLLFGALFSLSIFTPTAHNYKMWSFLGVIAACYASCYLTIAPILRKKARNTTYTAPHSYAEYFNGVSGYIYLGHDAVSVEIMDAMWKPQEFKRMYFWSIVYVLVVGMIPTFTIYLVYGDKTLEHPSALALLTKSTFYDTTVILLLVHQVIVFGIFVLGIYLVWEKFLGVHSSPNYIKRTLSRVPIFVAIFLAALAFPFYGVINRLADSFFTTWNLYIVPCAAYNAVFWSPSSRNIEDFPFSRIGWATDFSINLGIILWVVIVESGLGFWSGVEGFIGTPQRYEIFAKCYACP